MHQLYINQRGIIGHWDAIYARYLDEILKYGETFVGRNGETKALFGASVTVDLRVGFPLTGLRKMPIKNLFREFLFDIGFDQNVNALGPARHFWDFLADDWGNLGASAYNRQWRMWPPSAPGSQIENEVLTIQHTVDQLQRVIDELRYSRNSRRATVITHNPTAFNPACPPCHLGLQFAPSPGGYLDVMVPARSNDMVVGFPLDIARYAIILTVIAKAVGMKPRYVYMPSANSHVYENCYELARELISRQAMPECQLLISDDWDADLNYPLEHLKLEHLGIANYEAHEAMKVAVN
jgi:thymidylate synthase